MILYIIHNSNEQILIYQLKVRERELSDNLQLRKKREEVGEINAQIAEQKDKLEGFDVSNLQREIRKLQTKQEDLMKEVTLGFFISKPLFLSKDYRQPQGHKLLSQR